MTVSGRIANSRNQVYRFADIQKLAIFPLQQFKGKYGQIW